MTGVEDVLRRYSGQAVHFLRFPGNNGDRLIELGAREQFARLEVRVAAAPVGAAAIVVNGGGAITPLHKGEARILDVCQRYRDRPLVVLPSTFELQKPQAFIDAIAARGAPTSLIARDALSLERLRACGAADVAEVLLDHDMAFAVRGSAFLHSLRARCSRKHLLVVERTDIEEFTGRGRVSSPLEREQPAVVRALIPERLRRPLRDALAAARRTAFGAGLLRPAITPFTKQAREAVVAAVPAADEWPVLAADISQSSLCSFDTFCRLIAEAGAVVSNRLHAVILARLLDKPVFLYAGPGDRMRAVYDHSLAPMGGVCLLDGRPT